MSRQTRAKEFRAAAVLAAQGATDAQAAAMPTMYDLWAPGVAYGGEGQPSIVRRPDGQLYRIRQAHTSQTGWEPENAPALWTEICETHAGTLDDPIPYSGNMALESGKYYSQSGAVYLCTRDTVNPVYSDLANLVGLYVEKGA